MLSSWMSRFLVSSKFTLTVSAYEAYGLDDDAVPAVGEQDWWVEGLVPSVEEMAETSAEGGLSWLQNGFRWRCSQVRDAQKAAKIHF